MSHLTLYLVRTMPYRSICLLLPLLILAGCWNRDESPTGPSTPTPTSTVNPTSQALTAETRRALIAQRLAKRPLTEALQGRLVEAWVTNSEGYDQVAMDRLLNAIDSSIEAVDENRFNASKDLALGRTAVAGSTIMGALMNGLVMDGGGRLPIAIDCGVIRANGWVERSSNRSNRAMVIINSLSVQEATDRNVTYQHADGLAYVMGPDGLQGLTLQAVTDQRGNSWLGLRAGTLVTLILIRTVDQSLTGNKITATSAPVVQPLTSPTTPAIKAVEIAPPAAPATPSVDKSATTETPDKTAIAPVAAPTVPTEKPPVDPALSEPAPSEKPTVSESK